MHARISAFLVALRVLGITNAQASVHGVAPADLHLYKPDADGMWACLGDPSIRIPFDRVNDDYCDCPDGSDEPGTAACRNGKFWCAGSEQYIPSRLVGDGACDYEVCCDGSDETPGLCTDRCAEVKAAQAAREEAERAYIRDGAALRNELVQKAAQRKTELEKSLTELTAEIERAEFELESAMERVTQAEEAEATSNADEESMQALVELRGALVDADKSYDALLERFNDLKNAYVTLDRALETMSDEYNPNFNDPAVKAAIKTWKAATEPELTPPHSRDLHSDLELIDKVKVAGSEASSSLLSPFISWFTGLLGVGHSDIGSSTRGGHAVGPLVQVAKERVSELETSLSDLRQTKQLHEKLLELGSEFWGRDEVGRSSEDVCVSRKKGDFTYELCLFGTAVQLDGIHQVQLGRSTGLKQENSGDGQQYIEFVDGNPCPNGVRRSALIQLSCAHTTEALSIDEPETCRYVIQVQSPLACFSPDTQAGKGIVHDEL